MFLMNDSETTAGIHNAVSVGMLGYDIPAMSGQFALARVGTNFEHAAAALTPTSLTNG